MNKFKLILVILYIIFCCGDVSYGALSAAGPTSAQTNFPLFYTDSNNLSLELCLTPPDAGPPCFFDPVIQGNILSETTGFGGEGFWFLSEAAIDVPTVSGLLVMAIEAAYGAGDPEPDTQISFARVRIRIDVPNGTSGGTYTITYPYGVRTYADIPACVTDPGEFCKSVINDTVDVGVGAPGVFTGALAGAIGPFLTMDPLDVNYAAITAQWPGYIGDSTTPVKVVGSPFDTNYFRIEGPSGIDVQQNLFTLIGKTFTGNVPSALKIDRATYTRSAAPANPGHVDIFAASAPLAIVKGSGSGVPLTALSGDGAGNFYIHIPLTSATTLPPAVTVTADNSANEPTNLITNQFVSLTDFVTISRAEYSMSCGKLAIDAVSSDELAPVPQLSAAGFGNLSPVAPVPMQRLVVSTAGNPPVAVIPPSEISVKSAKGGSEKKVVSIVENIAPVAGDDAATTDVLTVRVIDVLANDMDPDGSINPASVSVVTPAAHGTAVANVDGTITYTPDGSFVGIDSFTYTAQDTPCGTSNLVATTNVATVTVTVTAAFTLQVTKNGIAGDIVASNPGGISCGQTCQADYPGSQLVTLTATPDPGNSIFINWTGD
ncbi:MAG: Ig-like domain-containing protein, partial [Thermodesulfovibrionales bacterium]